MQGFLHLLCCLMFRRIFNEKIADAFWGSCAGGGMHKV